MDDAQRSLRLGRINAKGMEVATKLSSLLAGKDVSLIELAELTKGGEPAETKEQRLRRFLDQVNASRARLLNKAGAAPYGACLGCGSPLADGALDEMPWVERCAPCVSKDTADRA